MMTSTSTKTSNLPSSLSSDLILTQPTDSEKEQTWQLNAPEWKGPLDLPAYLRRERMLASTPLAKTSLTFWILTSSVSKPGDRPILAACESVKNKALIAYDTSSGRRVQEVVTHRIGSVFCPPAMRKRGYASRMLNELGKILEHWQLNTDENDQICKFSVLFSDIGKIFYAKHGWHPFPSSHLSIQVMGDSANAKELPETKPLTSQFLHELCASDTKLIRERLALNSAKKIDVAIVPDGAIMDWHHSREELLGQELFGRKPEIKGAIIGEVPGKRAWCIWTRVWLSTGFQKHVEKSQKNTLYILRLVVEDEIEFGEAPNAAMTARSKLLSEEQTLKVLALLLAAESEASKWHMHEVQIWNPTRVVQCAGQRIMHSSSSDSSIARVQFVEREEESITSLMWYSTAYDASPRSTTWRDIEWVANEKYCWC